MKSKIESKTAKAKTKAKAKAARKCGGCAPRAAKAIAAVLFAAALAGCSTSDSAQPAKSQTQNNTFEDCIIIVAAKVRLPTAGTNKVIEADGGALPSLELFTQTQALESNGAETFSQTATQTPTTDVKPDLDVHYNDAAGKGADAAKGVLETLTAESAATLRQWIAEKRSGTLAVTKKDGTAATVECKDGQCSPCVDCAK